MFPPSVVVETILLLVVEVGLVAGVMAEVSVDSVVVRVIAEVIVVSVVVAISILKCIWFILIQYQFCY